MGIGSEREAVVVKHYVGAELFLCVRGKGYEAARWIAREKRKLT